MTQEEKELLIKDLCGRLPYGVKVRVLVHKDDPSSEETLVLNGFDGSSEYVFWTHDEEKLAKYGCRGRGYYVGEVKPYLRPMISMTEDEENQFQDVNLCELPYRVEGLDWLNAHHFDYRGLIPNGLALEAPKDMYNN